MGHDAPTDTIMPVDDALFSPAERASLTADSRLRVQLSRSKIDETLDNPFGTFRDWYEKKLGNFIRQHVSLHPNQITAARVPLALGVAALSTAGHHDLATALFAFMTATDAADGMVARATGKTSAAGGRFDSFSDKVSIHLVAATEALELAMGNVRAEVLATLAGNLATDIVSHGQRGSNQEQFPDGILTMVFHPEQCRPEKPEEKKKGMANWPGKFKFMGQSAAVGMLLEAERLGPSMGQDALYQTVAGLLTVSALLGAVGIRQRIRSERVTSGDHLTTAHSI